MYFIILKNKFRVGEMAQLLRACTDLAKALSQFPASTWDTAIYKLHFLRFLKSLACIDT